MFELDDGEYGFKDVADLRYCIYVYDMMIERYTGGGKI
jgi:hypothetical protein